MKTLLLLIALATPAHAAPDSTAHALAIFAGLNGLWYNTPTPLPSDFEAGGTARASLSPHLSLVGSSFYGFSHPCLRGSAGVRVTATDVDNPDFAIGLGIQYQVSSNHALRPQEWAPDVSLGWRPWPQKAPKVILGAQGAYGLDSQQAYLTAALRYRLDFTGVTR